MALLLCIRRRLVFQITLFTRSYIFSYSSDHANSCDPAPVCLSFLLGTYRGLKEDMPAATIVDDRSAKPIG